MKVDKKTRLVVGPGLEQLAIKAGQLIAAGELKPLHAPIQRRFRIGYRSADWVLRELRGEVEYMQTRLVQNPDGSYTLVQP